MSHFVVMVIGDDAEKQLEKYDDSLELPPYIKHTKDELVALKRKEIEDYRNTVYAKYLENKELYKQGCENERHIEYLENEFPQKLHWSDEQVYQDAIKYSEIDEKGNVISTCNPDAKWDWYVRGGRWAGYLWLKEGTEPLVPVNFSWGWSEEEKQKVIDENRADVAVKKDIANLDNIIPFAIVKDGHWYEKGQMGWWAVVLNEKDDHIWEEEVKKLLEGLSEDTIISIYDCHI